MAKAKGGSLKKDANDSKARGGVGKDPKKPETASARGSAHATGSMKKGKK